MNVTIQSLEIIEKSDMSIADMCTAMGEGTSVVRSAHVGNMRPYNLALAASGINMLLVDHNMTGVDVNYRPQSVIEAGDEKVVAPLDQLSCRTRTSGGEWVDDFHIAALKQVLPDVKVATNTASIQAERDIVEEIVGIAIKTMPEIFRRVAQENGKVESIDDAATRIKSGMPVMQLMDDPRAEQRAVLMPNEIDIVKDFVIEVLKTGKPNLIHLSGPDMVSYLGFKKDGKPTEAKERVTRLFNAIRQTASFKGDMPLVTSVSLVPSTAARFVTTVARKDALDKLLDVFRPENFDEPLARVKKERGDFARSADKKDADFKARAAEFSEREKRIVRNAAEATRDVPELFVGAKENGFLTQYDLVKEGGIYIPDITRRATMAELESMFSKIVMARKTVLT